MSDIKFNCRHCGQALEAPVEMIGETINCPACSKSLTVTSSSPSPRTGHLRRNPVTNTPGIRTSSSKPRRKTLVVSVTALLTVCLCSFLVLLLYLSPRAQVKRALSTFIEAEHKGNAPRAYAVISSSDQKVKTQVEYAEELTNYHEDATYMKRVSFTVHSVAITNDEAVASVTRVFPDLDAIMGRDRFAAYSSDPEEKKQYHDKLQAKLADHDIPMSKGTDQYQLVREQSGWKVFLNWEGQRRAAEAKAQKIQELIKDAGSHESNKEFTQAIASYQKALELDYGNSTARSGIEDNTQSILTQADDLRKKKNFAAALDLYRQLLKLVGSNYAAKRGIDETADELRVQTEKQVYIRDNLEIYDVTTAYQDSLLNGRVPGVNFKIKNKGNRTLSEIKVSVFFKNKDGKVISEETYYPVNTSAWLGSNAPLKPGYIWQMERGKCYAAKNVPDEWQEGNATVEITDVELDSKKTE